MKKFFYMAVAAIAALSSCSTEDSVTNDIEAPVVKTPPTFTATIEGTGTRTALGEGNKVNWESGDEVFMVFVGGSYNAENDGFEAQSMATYQATPDAVDATKATLSIKEGENYDPAANILMFAIYPASLFDLQNGFNFPATQVYADDGQIPYAPMAVNNVEALRGEGEAIPSTLNFKNAGALLKITVPYSQMHSVSSITVSSNLAMNGAATIGGSGNLYIQEPETVTTENSKITLDCGTGVTIPEGSNKTFYVSILAPGAHFTCQYDYLQIDVTDGTTTKSMRTMKTGGIEIVTNKIYPITFAENYVAWENPLTLGRYPSSATGATSIVFETGVDVSTYTEEDATHKKLNAAGTLWEVLDGQVLKVQTSADKIKAPVISSGLFKNYYKVESIANLNKLDMSAVTNIKGLFAYCQELKSLDLSSFNTSNVTDMNSMFFNCYNLTEIIGIENLNTSNVTNMSEMFGDCSGLTALDVSNFNTSNVENMSGMFFNCSGLTELNVTNFNTSEVTDMNAMFNGCRALQELDLSNFNTDNVTDMSYMFYSCQALRELDLSKFNTENVANMSYMFYSCSGLTALDVSNFVTSNVTDMSCMFADCYNLTSLTLGVNFTMANVMNKTDMFWLCGDYVAMCYVYGPSDDDLRSALMTDTKWNDLKNNMEYVEVWE